MLRRTRNANGKKGSSSRRRPGSTWQTNSTAERWTPPRAGVTTLRGLRQQYFEALGDCFGGGVGGDSGGEAALRVHHVDDRAVVHVIAAVGARPLRGIGAVRLRRLGYLLGGAGQRGDRRIEARDVGFERLGGVAF